MRLDWECLQDRVYRKTIYVHICRHAEVMQRNPTSNRPIDYDMYIGIGPDLGGRAFRASNQDFFLNSLAMGREPIPPRFGRGVAGWRFLKKKYH